MRKKKSWTVLASICLGLILLGLLLMGACAPEVPAPAPAPPSEPIELELVTFIPKMSASTKIFLQLIDAINERAAGQLTIKHVGGPEVIAGPQIPIAVQKGQIDMAWVPSTFYEGLVPIGDTLSFSQLTLTEERDKGVWDYLNDLHEEAGLFALYRGTPVTFPFFIMVSTERIDELSDFVGLKGGCIALLGQGFVEALGMSFNRIPVPEVYTALERGVIDVFVSSVPMHVRLRTGEVAPYAVDHPFFGDDSTIIITLDTWNRLPKNIRNLIEEVYWEQYPEQLRLKQEQAADSKQQLIEMGVEFVKFSPAEAEQFIETAYEAERAKLIKHFPETAPKILELLSK